MQSFRFRATVVYGGVQKQESLYQCDLSHEHAKKNFKVLRKRFFFHLIDKERTEWHFNHEKWVF